MSCINSYRLNILRRFCFLYEDCKITHIDAIKRNILKPEIKIIKLPDCSFRTPFFSCKEKQIYLHESFLIYLWKITYFIFFKYEAIFQPGLMLNGALDYKKTEVKNAYELFKDNIENYQNNSEFNFKLPNPCYIDQFSVFEKENMGMTNSIFVTAVTYILWHEFFHAIGRHCDLSLSNDDKRELEKEADNYARRTIFRESLSEREKLNCGMGIIAAHISMLFLVNKPSKIKSSSHFDTDDRLIHTMLDFKILDEKFKNNLESIICDSILTFIRISGIKIENTDYFEDFSKCLETVLPYLDRIKGNK